MQFHEHEEAREWALEALDALEAFVTTDNDFRGNKVYELKALGYQKRFVTDGKYRVVFLGTFNVGKSTAINAFLGGGYLPMDVEECTSKLTFIQRGDRLQLVMTLAEPASSRELDALSRSLGDISAVVSSERDGHELQITYASDHPDEMRRSLEPLVTVMADEEYPLLAPLREKIEDLNLYLPAKVLQEDIAFVDTPGVHSVSETRAEITYGIIDRSHLVISFVDSSFAGNIHDLNFIKRIIKWRGRKVFFVLNKADKLESEEIDVRGARGPARALLEAFERNDIPEDSEIFFLSGYRALRAQQLDNGQIALDTVLDDNKISIPTSVSERLDKSSDPLHDLSGYLMGQSRFPHLKERLLDYLLNENKAGMVVGTAAHFIVERADDYVVSLENELNLARDPSKFDELRENREQLMIQLDEIRAQSDRVLNEYSVVSKGGQLDGQTCPGYETMFRDAMTEDRIREEVVKPTLGWLRTGNNLKDCRRQRFAPLSAQMEHQVDEFVSGIMVVLHEKIEAAEKETREAIATHLGQVRGLRQHLTEPGAFELAELNASMAGDYVTFGAGGAFIGAAAGAAVGSVVPVIGTAIGAGLGGLVGALGGFITRLARGEERWLKKLEPVIRENVFNMLIHGGKDKDGNRARPILESVTEYLNRRADTFYEAVQEEVDNAIAMVQRECDDLLAREEEIRAESDAIIARLEPKVKKLHALRDDAQSIVDSARGQETVRV